MILYGSTTTSEALAKTTILQGKCGRKAEERDINQKDELTILQNGQAGRLPLCNTEHMTNQRLESETAAYLDDPTT